MGASVVFLNVLIMLIYMAAGYGVVKIGKAKAEHAFTLSGILLYVCTPCMIFSAFQSMDSAREKFPQALLFMLCGVVIMLLYYALLWCVLHRRYAEARYRVMTAGGMLGNVGFFGLPLVSGLFPGQPEVICYSTMFLIGMNIVVFTLGVYMITGDKKFVSVRQAIMNPTSLSVLVGLPAYLLHVQLPGTFADMITLIGKMTTPLCMIILGLRLSTMKLRDIFSQPFAYVVSALKLIALPLFAFFLTAPMPFLDSTFRTCLVVLCATPSAAIILSLAELYHCEQKLCANVLLMTTLCSLITLPLLMLLIGG